jgi:hypothetical protein
MEDEISGRRVVHDAFEGFDLTDIRSEKWHGNIPSRNKR